MSTEPVRAVRGTVFEIRIDRRAIGVTVEILRSAKGAPECKKWMDEQTLSFKCGAREYPTPYLARGMYGIYVHEASCGTVNGVEVSMLS